MTEPRPHSAEYFGEVRDYWWNADFLALVAQRWRLADVHRALDVGCGVGHWGTLLSGLIAPEAEMVGVDREPEWVAESARRASGRRYSSQVASVETLPFPDDTFDLVTCQTVLIHLADPARAIREMMRVTKPGGLVAVAEPNNIAESLLLDSVSMTAPVDAVVDRVRFQLTCERGKIALGEGNNSLGGLVPGLFASCGLDDVHVFANDKVPTLFPPYTTKEQQVFVAETRRELSWNWSEPVSRRYFEAGGGAPEAFAGHWERALTSKRAAVAAVDAGSYAMSGGGPFYLVSGTKR